MTVTILDEGLLLLEKFLPELKYDYYCSIHVYFLGFGGVVAIYLGLFGGGTFLNQLLGLRIETIV